MEQFQHIGEVLGGMKALMVLRDDIPINRRQCCLLLDIFALSFKTIGDEIRQNLRLEEKNTKWKVLDRPLKELHRIFKEGEFYIRNCLDAKDLWGKAISLHQNNDCVEFHVHNLLSCFPIIIEAIETAGEISGLDPNEMQKKTFVLDKKYGKDWNDPKLFQWKFGSQYLVSRELCNRFESAWREDRWLLLETVREKMRRADTTKEEHRIGDLLLTINGMEQGRLFPSSILLGAKNYCMRRRLGSGNRYREIQWLGESFALRHFYGDVEPLNPEIANLLSLSHPNIAQHLCGFYDEEKKECSLLMDLMNKDLGQYIKEVCGARRQLPFPVPVSVDIMLQIARGMEYLHSRKIYHGELSPSNVLIKPRSPFSATEAYFHVKISGFGLSSVKDKGGRRSNSNQDLNDPVIWQAPEVIAQQEQNGNNSTHTEKTDVYSFGMLCFELLTGKVPFEDVHLQGDRMSRNILAGERPLFPYCSPKCLANLTRKCWQAYPDHRPSFSSIARILRYIKKFLVMNPDLSQLELPFPSVDCCDLEAKYLKTFSGKESFDMAQVSQIPFQMFAYRLMEKDTTCRGFEDQAWDSESGVGAISLFGEENLASMEYPFLQSNCKSVCSEMPDKRIMSLRRPNRNIKRSIAQTVTTECNQSKQKCAHGEATSSFYDPLTDEK